jgi:hypothetical protein
MSNRQSQALVKFEPVAIASAPGQAMLVFGVVYPAAVIWIELVTYFCAQVFFDPMPTYGYVAAAAFVPASNLLVWKQLRGHGVRHAQWLAFANGAAIAIASIYALVFLPLLPLAVVGVIVGVGILPLAPFVALGCAVNLCLSLAERHHKSLIRHLVVGIAAGAALLVALDVPGGATRLGIEWAASGDPLQRQRGLSLLRAFGDDELLLRLCYGAAGRPTGLLSVLVIFGDYIFQPQQGRIAVTTAEAREIYYRVHGVPFNAKPAPLDNGRPSTFADFQFDNDLGGTEVGGRLRGLHMVSSRLDGSISGDDAVAYLEWTVEFGNSALVDREARLELALPPGAVVSRATLWVGGEEREAAYGGRGDVRAAYQRVAVQQRRDPLLVTTKGADRVLAQAFPVPRNGGTIKFKLGITAPLEIIEPSKARLTLPALVDRNFSFGHDANHNVWIESKRPLAASVPGLAMSRAEARLFRITGAIGDRDLARPRQTIMVERNADTGPLAVRLGNEEMVVQRVAPNNAPPPTTLMFVIDGSARLAGMGRKLVKAFDAIPDGVTVGAIIASEPMQRAAPAPWSATQRDRVAGLLRSTSFEGGQDNAPALAEALTQAAAEANAMLIWIHGPQPVSFRDSFLRLQQTGDRLNHLPRVVLYGVEPGPNELLPGAPWVWSARSLPQTGSIGADLTAFLVRALNPGQTFVIERAQSQSADGLAKGSDHIARLWANERVIELMRANPMANRAAAVALATEYRLVTPVSGAVVLASQQQYDESRLTPVSQATVPTVPEPHEWALLLIAAAALIWLFYRSRQRMAAVS